MSDSLTFYAIRKEARDQAPEGVQRFIDDFFESQNVLGVDCFVAIDSEYKSPWNYMVDEDYEAGLSQEELANNGVFSWLEKHPKLVFKYNWR